MAGINMGRVIVGGLIAGVIVNAVEFIMNIVVLADDMRAWYAELGIAEPGGTAIGGFVVLGFVLGLLLAWTYAAIRPRFGPGPATAIKAGLAVWIGACAVPVVGWMLMDMGIPTRVGIIMLAYPLVELVLGAWAAAALYREEAAGA